MNIKLLTQSLFIILLLLSISCSSSKKEETTQTTKPAIEYLGSDYIFQYFGISNFTDNETNIKYLFDFANNQDGIFYVTTNKHGIKFEDNYAIIDRIYQRFLFANKDTTKCNNYDIVRINYKDSTKINFIEKKQKNKVELNSKFEMLDLNTLQNMLDYAEGDANRKKNKFFTYELYNKDNIKKVIIAYHNYGEWFSIDIL